jgi:hypothetical protein
MDILTAINIGSALIGAGVDIAGKLKGVFAALGHQNLTDDQINQIEAAAMADSEARRLRRIAMGTPDQ